MVVKDGIFVRVGGGAKWFGKWRMKKGKGRNNGLLPNSLRIISSCLKTVSTNASTVATTVRTAGASVAASISASPDDQKDQVTWAGFDILELGPSAFKHVLLLGYQNGFQVLDVEDASNFIELVSKRDGLVTFLQVQPIPLKSNDCEGFRTSHPLLLVVAGDETNGLNPGQKSSHVGGLGRDVNFESQSGNCVNSPTAVQFYSLKSQCYVHVLRFRSAVCMVRCSPWIVAVGLATQIYCFDALTLENKFSVLTYPVPQFGGQGTAGVNIGYGPMAVGARWLGYASNNPLQSNTSRLSPQNLTSPGVSPSTSPGSGNLVARYAVESSKHVAAGIFNLGDMGYKTLSKYCQDLLPDGSSSPVSPSSGWKMSRSGASETDTAGVVVVRDFVSRAVISQFRAHTSPISALCFDPSGTLLVTASVYGNTINIFRIMPFYARSGSGSQNYDWSCSHVHLYKLYRGIMPAIIQDICFSSYSQWIAIVSSKGTCHIFVLSPFGGEAGFQTLSSQGEEPSLFPVVSLPWWFNSSCIVNQQSYPPPSSVVLSVVSRIKCSSSGWLNTVSNAAASATGKVFVPSGAVAAVFHNSISCSRQHVNTKVSTLEHLLVYTPSGHVIQHDLVPSFGVEPSDNGSRLRSSSVVQVQDEELRVKVEPIQWWDVCRRSDWPEREECVSVVTLNRPGDKSECKDRADLAVMSNSARENKEKMDLVKPHERGNWYLSNAEVQISCGRLPVWQKSKICFYLMDLPRVNIFAGGGEFEIEKVPIHEVEIRRKDLMPVFDHFHSIKPGWNDRGLAGGRYTIASSLEPHQVKSKFIEETVICHSKPASLSSTDSSDGGSSRRTDPMPDLDQIHTDKSNTSMRQMGDEFYHERRGSSILNQKPLITIASFPSDLPGKEEGGSRADNCADRSMGNTPSPMDSGQCFQESDLDESRRSDVAMNDVDSIDGNCEREKNDEENDEMFGDIFSFSEEG